MSAALHSRRLPLIVLAAVMALAALYVGHEALAFHDFQQDESLNVGLGRSVAADPGQAFSSSPIGRGLERLTGVVLGLPLAIFGNTPDQIRASHVLLVVLFVLGALFAYLLARLLELPQWWAVGVAAASLAGPWLVFGTSLLNVTIAYPLTTAFVWALCRTALRPSLRADALLLVVFALMVLARVGEAPYALAIPVALLERLLRGRPPGETLSAGLRRLPVRLWRAHPLLVGVGVAGLALVLGLGTRAVVGHWYARFAGDLGGHLHPSVVLQRLEAGTAQLGLATGLIAFAIGAAWTVREAVRPRATPDGVFAVSLLAVFLAFAIASTGTGDEERYLAPLWAFPVVAAGAALGKRRASWLGTLVAGLVLARCVDLRSVPLGDSGYGYFTSPARLFFHRVIVGRASDAFGAGHAVTIVVVLAALAAAALAWGTRSPRWRGRLALASTAVVAVAALGYGVASGRYVPHALVSQVGFPGASLDTLGFVEKATGNRPAAIFEDDPFGLGYDVPTDGRIEFFNARSIVSVVRLKADPIRFGIGGSDTTFDVDPASGRVTLGHYPHLPDYLVTLDGYHRQALSATPLAHSPVFAATVARLRRPLTGAYDVEGAAADGWIDPHKVAEIHAFVPCLSLTLSPPPVPGTPAAWAIRSSAGVRMGTAQPGVPNAVVLRGLRPGETVRVRFPGAGGTLDADKGKRPVSGGLSSVAAC